MSTLHCALENEANLYVNKRKKIQHYHARSVEKRRRRRRKKKNAKARSTEERRRKKNVKCRFFTSRGVYVNYAGLRKLRFYSDVIH